MLGPRRAYARALLCVVALAGPLFAPGRNEARAGNPPAPAPRDSPYAEPADAGQVAAPASSDPASPPDSAAVAPPPAPAPSAAAPETGASPAAPGPAGVAGASREGSTETPLCDDEIVLEIARYANVDTPMVLPDGARAPHHDCFVCLQGNFCALGTKPRNDRVVVELEGRIVAVNESLESSSRCNATGVKKAVTVHRATTEPVCKEPDAGREAWFVSIPTLEVPSGSVVTVERGNARTRVVQEGTAPRRSSFSIDIGGVGRWNSALGPIGTGIGIATTTRSVNKSNIGEAPKPDDVSRFGLGLRYDVALFAQDWLHRLSVIAELDLCRTSGITVAAGAEVGLAATFQNGANSIVSAGLLAGASAHIDWEVAWQVATVVAVSGQTIVVNGKVVYLLGGSIGPRVSW